MKRGQICNIPYTKPSITDLEVQHATDAATNAWDKHCYIDNCIFGKTIFSDNCLL